MYASDPSALEAPDDEPVTAADALARRQLQQLQVLGEMGMEIARRVHRQVMEAGDAEAEEPRAAQPMADLGLAFTRIARTVRLTLALEAQVQAQMDERRNDATAEAARRRRSPQGLAAVEEIKRRLHAIAGMPDDDAYDGEGPRDGREAAEFGWRELRERLIEGDDADEDDRPVGEIIGEICRNLGVAPDWRLWAQEDVACEARFIAPPLGELSAQPTEGAARERGHGGRPEAPASALSRGPPHPEGEELGAEPP